MDEIQNNPNVPEDVKAAITGALSLAIEEDEPGVDTCEEGLPPVEGLDAFDDDYIMDMSDDDGKKNRRRRIDENDEDWLTCRRKMGKPKKSKRKHKKRSKKRSEHSESGKNSSDKEKDKEKIKKKRSRKSNDTTNSVNNSALSMSSTLSSTMNNSLDSSLNGTMNSSTNASFSGYENLMQNHELTNGLTTTNGFDTIRKENKPKKAPKKRDSTEKPVNGIVKKTSRRQFTSLSAIIACIESVVKGNDASISETSSEVATVVAIKTEPFDDTFKIPKIISPMKQIKVEDVKIECNHLPEPKKKPRRSSTSKKSKERKEHKERKERKERKKEHKTSKESKESKEAVCMIKVEATLSDQCSAALKPIVKKSPTNGAKSTRTSMKKVKFLS